MLWVLSLTIKSRIQKNNGIINKKYTKKLTERKWFIDVLTVTSNRRLLVDYRILHNYGNMTVPFWMLQSYNDKSNICNLRTKVYCKLNVKY